MLNKCVLCGRLTRDPEIRISNGDTQTTVAKYSIAVDRKYSKGDDKQTDFINCVAFGKSGEFAEKYLHKGMKILVVGRIQTGSYNDKDGRKVYTTDVVVEEHEFCESKNSATDVNSTNSNNADGEFMKFDGSSTELPF